jgi:hypothetical protein
MAKGSNAHKAGSSFAAGVLAKLPEAQRAQVEAILSSDDAVEALEVLGTGALAQPDYNRRLEELREKTAALDAKQAEVEETFTKQTDWWNSTKDKVQEYDRIKPEYDTLKSGGTRMPANGQPPQLDDLKKEFDEKLSQLSLQGVGLMAFMTTLGVKHFREFGEEPDMPALLADKNLGKPMPDGRTYGVVQAYETKYGEQIKARAAKAEDDRISKLVDERFRERMKSADQPFPMRGSNPSVLDVLESATDKPEAHTVDTATALYETLTAARG